MRKLKSTPGLICAIPGATLRAHYKVRPILFQTKWSTTELSEGERRSETTTARRANAGGLSNPSLGNYSVHCFRLHAPGAIYRRLPCQRTSCILAVVSAKMKKKPLWFLYYCVDWKIWVRTPVDLLHPDARPWGIQNHRRLKNPMVRAWT